MKHRKRTYLGEIILFLFLMFLISLVMLVFYVGGWTAVLTLGGWTVVFYLLTLFGEWLNKSLQEWKNSEIN